MPSSSYAQLFARNLTSAKRDLRDVKQRASCNLKELRRSKRSAVLNQFRKIPAFVEVRVKKTAAEEKLDRLKAYKKLKEKKMEELKKTQKPPFYSIVKSRHTGGTPFRDSNQVSNRFQVLKKPVLNLPASTRSRGQAQRVFEFKSTLGNAQPTSSKPQATVKNVISKSVEKLEGKKNVPAGKINKKPLTNPKETKRNIHDKENKVVNEQRPIIKRANANQINTKTRSQKTKESENKPELKTRPQRNIPARQIVSKPETNVKPKEVESLKKKGKQILQSQENIPPKRFAKKVSPSSKVTASSVSKQLNDMTNTNHNVLTSKQQLSNGVNTQALAVNTANKRKTRSQTNSRPGSAASDKNIPLRQEKNVKQDENKSVETDPHTKEREERRNGVNFQRTRLQNEITRLSHEADTWDKRREEDIPDNAKDEILAVVGQTKLLLSEKFQKFNALIDKCDSDEKGMVVTLQDLEGFWDMMYQQVEQLDGRYRTLVELENNNWQEKDKVVSIRKKKKSTVKKTTKPAASKFREFLKAKQNNTEIPVTPKKSPLKEDRNADESSVYLSASKGDHFEPQPQPDFLKTPRSTPAVQRALNSSRSRRSSAGLIILKQRHLIKSISSTPQKI